MEIVSLTLKSKRNPNVFVASTDLGEYELHSDIIVKNAIKVGELEQEIFFNSVKESEEIIAFNLCTKYISSKLKTEKQIKDYLYKHEYCKNTVDKVVEKLKEYKIIDDKMFAEVYIRANSNFSKNKVKQKLAMAGIKKDLMVDTTDEVDDFSSCKHNAEKFLKNKIVDKFVVEKLYRRLISQGYTWETIKSVLYKLKIEAEEI